MCQNLARRRSGSQCVIKYFGLGVIGLDATLMVQSREVAGSIPAGSTFLLFFLAFFFGHFFFA